MRLHKRSSRLGRGRPRKALHGWLATTVQGRLARFSQTVCSGIVCLLVMLCEALPLCARKTGLFLGVGGERTHWYGELMASRMGFVEMRRCGLEFCAIEMAFVVHVWGVTALQPFGSCLVMLGLDVHASADRSVCRFCRWRASCLVLDSCACVTGGWWCYGLTY